jgi:hypothetical protein
MTDQKIEFESYDFKFLEEVTGVMQGAMDLHCHAGPSLIPRKIDAAQAARQAADAGFAAVLVKDHHLPTARDVRYVKEYIIQGKLGVDLMGGIALNHTIGGLNPYAVETALYFGARIVYLPTVSSRSHKEHHQKEVVGAHFPATARKFLESEPIDMLDADGNLPNELPLIMELVRDADAILSMGHLSSKEINAVLAMAAEIGNRRLLVHHPTFVIEASDVEILGFVEKGAMIEFSACMSDPRSKFYCIDFQELQRLIRMIGIDSVIIGSDLGQHDTPPFIEGMMVVADGLLGVGMKPDELRMLFRENPSRIVY